MMFHGRYHLVRNWWLPTNAVGPPMVLDRKEMSLCPYLGNDVKHEWEPHQRRRDCARKLEEFKAKLRTTANPSSRLRMAERFMERDGDCSRLAAVFDKGTLFPMRLLYEGAVVGTQTNIALSTAYTAGSAGPAIAGRYQAPVGGKTINNVYFWISSYNGTAANVNDINLELRPEASAGATTPDTAALTESKIVDPLSTTGWINSSGWTSTISALTRVYFIVADGDGSAADFANVVRNVAVWDAGVAGALSETCIRFMATSTTGGWASGNTVYNFGNAKLVLVFSDGTVFGDPLTVVTAPASDTNRRGLIMTSSVLIANVPIFGMIWSQTAAAVSGMEVWAGATGPSGTADNVSTDIIFGTSGTSGRAGAFTSGGTPYTLLSGTQYRIVATYSSSSAAGPQRYDIGTGTDANLRKAMPGGGNIYYTRASGTTDWSNDLADSIAAVGLLVDGQVAASSNVVGPITWGVGPHGAAIPGVTVP